MKSRRRGSLSASKGYVSMWVVTTPNPELSAAGITVDKSGLIYFVDGTMIRRIDQNGVISTLLGSNDLTSARPLSCDSVMDISQVRRKLPLSGSRVWVCTPILSLPLPTTQAFRSTLLVLGLWRALGILR